jgi:hypothetical protein
MAKSTPDTILIKGDAFVVHEAVANAALTPGEFVKFNSSGEFIVTVAADNIKLIVIEDDLQGNEITDDYTAANIARAAYMQPGSIVRAIIADGQNISIGDELEMTSGGELTGVGSAEVVAVALEANDSSDSAATAQNSRRCNVMLV